MMKVVINHLTRMEKGYFCVAGVDWTTGNHVRPILPSGRLRNALLAPHGGPFDMANIVELGTPKHWPTSPHIEDYMFALAHTKRVGRASPDRFWRFLCAMSKPRLTDIFGDDLKSLGPASCGTDEGQGLASLGCLHPKQKPLLHLETKHHDRPRIRLRVSDGEFDLALAVTDIRLYQGDHATPDPGLVETAAARIRASKGVILSVGLGRAKRFSENGPAMHWLQANNIHLKEDPTWQLG